MALIHPEDLEAWRRWRERRDPLYAVRRMRAALRPNWGTDPYVLRLGGPDPDLLIALDSRGASTRAALVAPISHLPIERIAVLSTFDVGDLLPRLGAVRGIRTLADLRAALPDVRTLMSLGNDLPSGALAHELITSRGGESLVVQHGLLSPHAPPLAKSVMLAAWSEADGDFWTAGRPDVRVEVAGSQLLFHAAQQPELEIDTRATPVFLGQLHGTELSRSEMMRISAAFCRSTGAWYRVHPSETDVRSRLTHDWWRRRGIQFESSGLPLESLAMPIVGVFSTGVLEAAAAGRPAWVYHPDPPSWVSDLWERYGLSAWGSVPTPRPMQPTTEPARRIAELLQKCAS